MFYIKLYFLEEVEVFKMVITEKGVNAYLDIFMPGMYSLWKHSVASTNTREAFISNSEKKKKIIISKKHNRHNC